MPLSRQARSGRASEGNGCAENFALPCSFRQSYNATWLIERRGFVTPAAVRQTQLRPAALAA
jgi:hypothetical protein